MLQMSKKEHSDIKLLIAKKGISQKEFAEFIGISDSYLSQVINGKKKPSPSTAGKIANGLDININEIFFISNGNKR